jgi:hypothetical protein
VLAAVAAADGPIFKASIVVGELSYRFMNRRFQGVEQIQTIILQW